MRCLADKMRLLAKKMRRLPKKWHGVWPTTARPTRSTPSPARGGGNAPSLRDQRSRPADEIGHGGLGGMRREADGGGAGGGKRLRDLAGETKVHGRERTLEHAGALGAIEIGLRAAAGKMQDAVERTARQRDRDRGREAFDLDRTINHRGQERHAARGKIAGAVLAGEIEERRGTFVEARTQERGKIVLVAVGAFDRTEASGARRLGGVAADREGGKPGERFAPRMAGDGARGVRARHHHRAQRLAREFDIDGVDGEQRRERDLVAARAQTGGGALAVMLRPCHQQTHAVTRLLGERVPGAAQREPKASDALQTRDRCGPWRSRISSAPLHFVSQRCTASGTRHTEYLARMSILTRLTPARKNRRRRVA